MSVLASVLWSSAASGLLRQARPGTVQCCKALLSSGRILDSPARHPPAAQFHAATLSKDEREDFESCAHQTLIDISRRLNGFFSMDPGYYAQLDDHRLWVHLADNGHVYISKHPENGSLKVDTTFTDLHSMDWDKDVATFTLTDEHEWRHGSEELRSYLEGQFAHHLQTFVDLSGQQTAR